MKEIRKRLNLKYLWVGASAVNSVLIGDAIDWGAINGYYPTKKLSGTWPQKLEFQNNFPSTITPGTPKNTQLTFTFAYI